MVASAAVMVVVPADAVKAAASTRRVLGSEGGKGRGRGGPATGMKFFRGRFCSRAALRLWFLRRLLCRCPFHSSCDDADGSFLSATEAQ